MPSDLAGNSWMTAEIRTGIHRPDWSVVIRPAAREALLGRDRSRIGLAEKWNHALEPAQDRVWRTVIELFARSGTPPHLHEIGEETDLSAENLRRLVAELQAYDLLGSDPSADVILYVSHGYRYRVLLPRLRRRYRSRHRPRRKIIELCATRRCHRMVRSRLQRVRSGIVLPVDRVLLL
jgi:hypothetical protein